MAASEVESGEGIERKLSLIIGLLNPFGMWNPVKELKVQSRQYLSDRSIGGVESGEGIESQAPQRGSVRSLRVESGEGIESYLKRRP